MDDSENAALSVSERVIEAVAEEDGISAAKMPVLYDAIDSGALDQLVNSVDARGEVSFTYNGYEVTVGGDGGIHLGQAALSDEFST